MDQDDKKTILIIEDVSSVARIYEVLTGKKFPKSEYEILKVDNLLDAVATLYERKVEAIFLDNGFFLDPKVEGESRTRIGASRKSEDPAIKEKELTEEEKLLSDLQGSTAAMFLRALYHGDTGILLPRDQEIVKGIEQIAGLVSQKYKGQSPIIVLNTASPEVQKGIEAYEAVTREKLDPSSVVYKSIDKEIGKIDENIAIDPVRIIDTLYFTNKISTTNIIALFEKALLDQKLAFEFYPNRVVEEKSPLSTEDKISVAIARGDKKILDYALTVPEIAEAPSAARLNRGVSIIARKAELSANEPDMESLEAVGKFPRFDPNAFYLIVGTSPEQAARPLFDAVNIGSEKVVEWLLKQPNIRVTEDIVDKANELATKNENKPSMQKIAVMVTAFYNKKGVNNAIPELVTSERSVYEGKIPTELLPERRRYPDATQLPRFNNYDDNAIKSLQPPEKAKG